MACSKIDNNQLNEVLKTHRQYPPVSLTISKRQNPKKDCTIKYSTIQIISWVFMSLYLGHVFSLSKKAVMQTKNAKPSK